MDKATDAIEYTWGHTADGKAVFTGGGKTYTVDDSDVYYTNRVFSNGRNIADVDDGETYDFEVAAPAIDEDGEKYTIYWIFEAVKGEEFELDGYDYSRIDRIEKYWD